MDVWQDAQNLSTADRIVIVISRTACYIKEGRPLRAAHLLSTIAGKHGRAELMAFAKRIGIRAEWLQHRQTPHEHFDLIGIKIEAAKSAGAKSITNHELAEILRDKREKLGLVGIPRDTLFKRADRREVLERWQAR